MHINFPHIGLFSLNDVESMVNEIIKMQGFKHPHVLSLIGVCLEPNVSMVMPFMINGSLLDYLKRERSNLEIRTNERDKVGSFVLKLISCYLSSIAVMAIGCPFILPNSRY